MLLTRLSSSPKKLLPKLDSSLFTFDLWGAGSLLLLGIATRFEDIVKRDNAEKIQRYAVGYTDAESLSVRPKLNCKAVMFCKDGEEFWTHLTCEEFEELFEV